MPKPLKFNPLLDKAHQISTTNLRNWGYLESNQIKSGVITWSRNGYKTSSVSISVNTGVENPHLELNYNYDNENRNYTIDLITKQSNLGKGLIWYFLCPHTYKLCRKLYLIDGYFFHREAFKNCLYESQTHSKKNRNLFKILDPVFKSDSLYSELYSKNFKKTYAGKPTKRYLKIMKQLKNAESLPYNEFERLLSI